MEKTGMTIVKLDPSKLLGFRLEAGAAVLSIKAGQKTGEKLGLKEGQKVSR
jgi:hypothetical protein